MVRRAASVLLAATDAVAYALPTAALTFILLTTPAAYVIWR